MKFHKTNEKQIQKNVKIKSDKVKALDKRSYLLFAIIGVLLVAVLMIIQTRFEKDIRLCDDGFAIVSGTVTETLNADPNDADTEIIETVSMYEFKALDYFYTQRQDYYLGDKKKTRIDTSYPVYIKHGKALQMVDSSVVLFDEDYEQVVTYEGLILQGGYAFNRNGEQADPMKYLFVELNNGNFINLGVIYYEEKNREYDINENSIVHFEDNYFSYYEYEDGVLLYKYRISVNDDTILNVGNVDLTYDELLKLLKLRSEKPEFDIGEVETESNTSDEEGGSEEETEPDIELEEESTPERNETEEETEDKPNKPSDDDDGKGNGNSPGVRPDYMRPDKQPKPDTEKPEKVDKYVKPTVLVDAFTANVYRLTTEITVNDPAKRIDKKRQIQFEVYEISKNEKETLVTRGYRSGTGTVILGGGSVKPSTKYHIVGFFTYADEYNVTQVEQLGNWYVETGSIDSLGTINLTHEQKNSYSDRIELENFSYDSESDDEAVYGINNTAGIKLIVKDEHGKKILTQKVLLGSDIASYKRQTSLVVSTLPVLEAKSTYRYEFVIEDFFGNKLKLTNEAGIATTCNHTPKAKITIEKNEIANTQLKINITDIDAAAITKEGSKSECDVYLVLTNRQYDVETLEDESVISYHKLEESEYEYSIENGLQVKDLIITFNDLDLDSGIYATVYCDYDLSNKLGAQRFKNIGQLRFTTTGLTSLGRIYVDVEFDEENLTWNSMPITFSLNNYSTNPELSKLIVGFNVDVVGGIGDDELVYSSLGFDKDTSDTDGMSVYKKFRDGMDVKYTANKLESMTSYTLKPKMYLEYNGKVYDNVPVVLTKNTFKTLRKPAEVMVDDLLFAAGTLVFDVTVDDPDETIIGASGDKVVVNLYTNTGEFVRATRILKNTKEPQTVTFTNLDVSKKYELRFIAVEYNEGYSNATYQSNHVLKTVKISKSMKLDGTIKLQEINSIAGDLVHNSAVIKATMTDEDHYLSGNKAIPYYITVEKNGKLIDKYEYWVNNEPVADEYVTNYEYLVDIGKNTYTLTLSVVVSGRTMILDTLEFTTETTVEGIANAYDMITKISENPEGKFVATDSFVLNGNSWNFPGIQDPGEVDTLSTEQKKELGIVESEGKSGTNITTIFNGEIDFQGFTLTHNFRADGQKIFTNIGSKGKLKNVVYKLYQLNPTYIYDDGCICYRNYGIISDIYVEFEGAINVLDNRVMSLITRVNCSTGIIENFVVNNTPGVKEIDGEEVQLNGFSAYQNAGLVTVDNYGIIRYGYVYGDNIIATNLTGNLDRRIGGIVGTNQNVGKVYSVYSLLNVDQNLRNGSQSLTYGYRYGGVCGYSAGTLQNLYSTAESLHPENKNDSVDYYQKSPVLGDSANRNSKVYYYSPSDFDYVYAVPKYLKGVSKMALDNLYDVGWQKSILTDNFDNTNVEVGYYPHVRLSEDLPEQNYIALPARTMSGEVDISRATVKEYYIVNKGQENEMSAALVEFVFSNRDGLDIASVEIDNLTVQLDLKTADTEDGYTTIQGLVSDPKVFNSEYLIRKVKYYRNNTLKENTTDYTLMADFYRSIYTVDDWYEHVVKKANDAACENVRLMADLDFEEVDASRIIVQKVFTAKLNGNGFTMKNINLQRGFNAKNASTGRNLFNASPSIDYCATVENLYIDNYQAGGTYTYKNKTYVARYGSVFRTVRGLVDSVHLSKAQITSFENVGGIASYVDVSGELSNCTVSDIEIIYKEPDDQNIDAAIGGVVGRVNNGRISHCLATGVKITAEEMKSSCGIGGVVGYSVNSVVDTAYAEGNIETRGTKAGGVVGEYYSTSASIACVKNIYAKVNIISYTDSVGALIGQANLTQDRISDRNNFSGIGFGNVYVVNPDSENITHTIGSNIGKSIKFHGTDRQLVNGMAGIAVNEYAQTVVVDLLDYDSLRGENAESTYRDVVEFEDVYDYSDTKNGLLPKMYYEGTNKHLPHQPDIKLDDTAGYDIEVTNVFTNKNTGIITVELRNPHNYKITEIEIDKLKYHFADLTGDPNKEATFEEASDYYEGYTRIYLKYEDEQQQEYFLDSYVLKKINFYSVKDSYTMTVDEAQLAVDAGNGKIITIEAFSRIGVTLCKDISTEEDWNNIAIRESHGHVYENYRIINSLDFAGKQISDNLKIGRLTATSGSGITIRNVNLDGNNKSLINRLNSGISNITFDNCSVSSASASCTGLIAINNGSVDNCHFKNITITPKTKNMDEAGIIAHQNGGKLTNITLENVKVYAYANNKTGIDYVGALCGRINDGSYIYNVEANDLQVYGAGTVGGLAGQIYISNIEDIVLSNIIVESNGNYVGGLAGRLGTDSNGRAGRITGIEILGTPTYDSDGVINGSTTAITSLTGSYTGGVTGQNYHCSGQNTANSLTAVLVDGIKVNGYANYIGGVYGYNYSETHHMTIRDSIIQTADTTNTTYQYVGGMVGNQYYGTSRYWTAEDIRIDSKNHSMVGGVVGWIYSANIQYSMIKDSNIVATSKTAGTWTQAGGFVGYHNAGTLIYNGVFNTVINADSMNSVGGIVGQLGAGHTSGASIQRCFNISDYDKNAYEQYGNGSVRYTAKAMEKYFVKGYNDVGGIIGKQAGGNVQYSYTNANVIAGEKQCAGGISGYYGNEYSIVGGTSKSYSNAYMYRNYFAGTVKAENGYAGGAIGRTGLLAKGYGTDASGNITGTGENGSRIKGINGNVNEKDRTYGNIIFADSIDGNNDKTRNFAADDKLYMFTGKNNTLWEGTTVNGNYTSNLKKDGVNYVYDYWNITNAVSSAYPLSTNESLKLLMFKTSDLDGSQIASSGSKVAEHNRASMFYRNIGWGLNHTNSINNNYANRNTVWAMSIGNVCMNSKGEMKNVSSATSDDTVGGMKNEYESTKYDTGSYLPQIRSATNTKYANDYSIKLQNTVARLPLPKDDNCARGVMSTLSLRGPVYETYGMVYASDVDKINLEFSYDLIGDGYYILKVDGVEVAKEIISQRVYTYDYDFVGDIILEYGTLTDVTLDESKLYLGNNANELNNLIYETESIANDIMVYKDDYYYISDEGIVTSKGTYQGDFVTMMHGKALDSDGNIWNVTDWKVEGVANSITKLDEVCPLWSFDYLEYDIATFAKFSQITSGISTVVRNEQLFVKNNGLYTVEGVLENRKTDILLYNLNGTEYMTILGNDGIMVDMFNADCNLPESVDNKAIVAMTDTIEANVPYVIVRYSNGGMIGYNYATGKILFDNSIPERVSLLSYAKDFFWGDAESKYTGISNSYIANAELADKISSTEDLILIIGNSTGELIQGNNTGFNTSETMTEQSEADSSNESQADGDISKEDTASEESTTEGTTTGDSTTDGDATEDSTTDGVTTEESTTEGTATEETTTESGTAEDNTTENSTTENVTTGKEDEEKPGSDGESIASTKFITIYNADTEVYEIVNVEEYLSQNVYISENEKLGIENFSQYSNGYASSKSEIGQENGIILYIIPILMIVGIAGAVVVYVRVKEHNNKGVND